jgi:RimJ/RimL family protein N-acetyltransferase
MIIELAASEFERTRPIFAGLVNRVAILAIIERHSAGRIFVDDANHPTSAFIWNEFRYSYLAGRTDNTAFNAALYKLLTETLLPEAQASPDPTLVLYPFPTAWHEIIGALFQIYSPFCLLRSTFRFRPERFRGQNWAANIPPGFEMRPIDRMLLETPGNSVAEGVRVLWRSIDEFLDSGFGFCLMHEKEVVSECYSVFAGANKCEIGLGTAEPYRRRGFALLTASTFIEHCIRHEREPVWECWAENTPSIALAEKLGFERMDDYPVFFFPPPSIG